MRKSAASRLLGAIVLTSALLASGVGHAATLGDPNAGKTYAGAHCASCHSILPGGDSSPVNEATPFQVIADTSGMTRTALIVFLRTPHPTMPNLIVQGDDADNLISYILSLKVSK